MPNKVTPQAWRQILVQNFHRQGLPDDPSLLKFADGYDLKSYRGAVQAARALKEIADASEASAFSLAEDDSGAERDTRLQAWSAATIDADYSRLAEAVVTAYRQAFEDCGVPVDRLTDDQLAALEDIVTKELDVSALVPAEASR